MRNISTWTQIMTVITLCSPLLSVSLITSKPFIPLSFSPPRLPVCQSASNTLAVMSRFLHVFWFFRGGFTQPRLRVRWRSRAPPSTLSFSRRKCRSVVVDLSLFSTEAVLCGCQKRPVACPAPCWRQALSRDCPLLPGCACMSESEDGWAGGVQAVWCGA